jgi:hypothetical protein
MNQLETRLQTPQDKKQQVVIIHLDGQLILQLIMLDGKKLKN